MFDEQATQILATTDLIAERVRKTGNTTLRSIGDISRHQSLVDNDADYVSPGDMLNELREDNLKLVESLRAAKAAATEAGDNATEGIIDDRSEEHTSETPVTNAHLVCRLLLEKKKNNKPHHNNT